MNDVMRFWTGVKNTVYDISGSPEIGVRGDCQDLCAWYSTSVMGYEYPCVGKTTLDMAVDLLNYWGRYKDGGIFTPSFYWPGFVGPGQPFYAVFLLEEIRRLRRPCYVYTSTRNADAVSVRHMMVVFPYKSGLYSFDLSSRTRSVYFGPALPLLQIHIRSLLAVKDPMDFLFPSGRFTDGGDIPLGYGIATFIPAPGKM
jgi:hypothetical protein